MSNLIFLMILFVNEEILLIGKPFRPYQTIH